MTEDSSVRVSLLQLLDLALGTPEVGSVNFNILHNLLHIVLIELNLANNNVEYQGDDANRMKNALAVLKTGPSLTLEAHTIIDGASKDREVSDVLGTPNLPSGDPSDAIHQEQTVPSGISFTVPTDVPAVVLTDEPSTVPSAPPSAVPSTELPNLTKEVAQINDRLSEFEKNLLYLNDDVTELRNTLSAASQPPTAPSAVPDEVESSDKSKQPIADEKLSEQIATIPESTTVPSIVSDKNGKVVGSQSELSPSQRTSSIVRGRSVIAGVDLIGLQTDVTELKIEMAQTKKDVEIIQSQINETGRIRSDKDFSTEKVIAETPINDDALLVNDDGHLIESDAVDADNDPNVPVDQRGVTPQDTPSPSPIDDQADEMHSADLDKSSGDTKKSHSKLHSVVNVLGEKDYGMMDDNEGDVSIDVMKTELTEAVQNMEIIYSEAVRNLEFRVAELEKEMKTLNETLSNKQIDGTDGIQGINELVAKIQDAYVDMEKINQTAARLIEEKEQRESHTNVLIEQIELLKTIKADKEDLEDALADKADASTVNKKVSYDRFNDACDDLARGLEDAISKLTQQEYVWQESLDTVQQEIDNKLDKIEISPIREFMNNRLQTLQEKIKELAEKKSENEAAGTRKVLTGLQCISCDKDAVMKIEQGANYQHIAVPPRRNIKPYLTYELDQIRKQQKKLPGKNMNHLNAAMQEMGRKTKPLTRDAVVEKTSRDHLCNRYCGGSHTVTTPQQRVMRMGHFLAQWGPEAVQLTQGVVRGTDGQLYHSQSMPLGASATSTRDVCGPGMNTCCGMQNTNSSNQQVQPNRSNATPESAPISQRHLSQKEKRRSDSLVQPTPRANPKNHMLSEGPIRSPTAHVPTGVNHDEYYSETRRQIHEDHHAVVPREI